MNAKNRLQQRMSGYRGWMGGQILKSIWRYGALQTQLIQLEKSLPFEGRLTCPGFMIIRIYAPASLNPAQSKQVLENGWMECL